MKNTGDVPEVNLASHRCKPCEDGQGRLNRPEIEELKKQLRGNWKLKGGQAIQNTFKFNDFKEALAFTNRVGEIAEEEGHHPDIYLTYGEVRIELSTHAAKGLTRNDFILAAKIDDLK